MRPYQLSLLALLCCAASASEEASSGADAVPEVATYEPEEGEAPATNDASPPPTPPTYCKEGGCVLIPPSASLSPPTPPPLKSPSPPPPPPPLPSSPSPPPPPPPAPPAPPPPPSPPPMTLKMQVRRWVTVLLPISIVLIAALCFYERDICLLLTFWIFGCCGCCSDFTEDELKFRKWQLLKDEEAAGVGGLAA